MDRTRVDRRTSELVDVDRGAAFAWGMPFVSGLLVMVLGFVAFWFPVIAGFASALVIGWLLTISGVVEIVGAFRRRHEGSAWLPILSGILTLVVGILFLVRPLVGVAALTLLVAAYFFASGLFRGITSIVDRYPRWGWDFAYGLVAVVAGAILLLGWPRASLLIIGMLVGIELIARGVALMATAWRVRRALSSQHGSPESMRPSAAHI